MQDKEAVTRFLESCGQFERIVNDSGLIRITRLTDDEITGTDNFGGHHREILLALAGGHHLLAGLSLGAGEMKVGTTTSACTRFPIRKTCRQAYPPTAVTSGSPQTAATAASPLPHLSGMLLTCNHIVNQYLFIDDSAEILRKFEQNGTEYALALRYSRSNQINREWMEEYLNEAHSKGLTSIRAHCNVMAWSDDRISSSASRTMYGQPAGVDGGQAAPQHGGRADPVLGGYTRQCR